MYTPAQLRQILVEFKLAFQMYWGLIYRNTFSGVYTSANLVLKWSMIYHWSAQRGREQGAQGTRSCRCFSDWPQTARKDTGEDTAWQHQRSGSPIPPTKVRGQGESTGTALLTLTGRAVCSNLLLAHQVHPCSKVVIGAVVNSTNHWRFLWGKRCD